jgi:hypothetical protein
MHAGREARLLLRPHASLLQVSEARDHRGSVTYPEGPCPVVTM